MAHLYVIRSSTSFVEAPGAMYGQHELTERAINRKKYPFSGEREGYNIPHACEIKLLEYRVKEECIADFVQDLGAKILNPADNKMTIWKALRGDVKFNILPTAGRTILFAQLAFRWFNRVNKVLHIIPLQPIPTSTKKKEKFTPGWQYNYVIGYLPDVRRHQGEEL